ncbi:MAG: YncE family protein, partial [Flavobacteriales bacterium]
MSVNDGLGDIMEGEKEIPFGDPNLKMASAEHADGGGRWLITAQPQGSGFAGQILFKIYNVDSEEFVLVFEDEYSYDWAAFEETFNDFDLSPDCETIACSFKGHYIALFKFDNESGQITSNVGEAADTGTGFFGLSELTFSPSGQYLYSLSQGTNMFQWDLSTWDAASIEASQTAVTITGSGLNDLKLGPDGSIYINNHSNNEIDRIPNPDDNAEDLIFEDGFISDFDDAGSFFPNTFNISCSMPPSYILEPLVLCEGQIADFNFSTLLPTDSVEWDFGVEDILDDTSTDQNPEYLYPNNGEYSTSIDVWSNGSSTSLSSSADVYAFPVVDLAEDLTVCQGETVLLEGPDDALTYLWSTNEISQSIQVSEAGTYSLVASNFGCQDQDEFVLNIIPLPDLYLGEDVVLCEPGDFIIEASTLGTWNTGEE